MTRWVVRILSMIVMLGLPLAALFTGAARLVPFLAMPLFVLGGPMLMNVRNRGKGPDSGSDDDSDSDDGPGGNKRPDHGPMTPSGPTGELPLEHSTPGSWRQRGNGRQRSADPGHRRTPHQPSRIPHRVTPSRHTR